MKKTSEPGKSAIAVASCLLQLEAFKEFEQKLIDLANTIEFVALRTEVDTWRAVCDNPTFEVEKKVDLKFGGKVITASYSSVTSSQEYVYNYPYDIRVRFTENEEFIKKFVVDNFKAVPTRNCKAETVSEVFVKLAKTRIEELFFAVGTGIVSQKLKEVTEKIREVETDSNYEENVRDNFKVDAFERIKNIAITYNLTDAELAEAMDYVVVNRVIKS